MSSAQRGPHERLLAHLLEASEQERRATELRALEDDDFFDQLRAAETELLDRYVGGELEASSAARLAELIARSGRLRQSAETTLALQFREEARLREPAGEGEQAAQESVSDPALGPGGGGFSKSLRGRRRPWPLAAALVLIALALWLVVSLRQEVHGIRQRFDDMRQDQRNLEAEVHRLEREIEILQQEQLRLHRRWAETVEEDGSLDSEALSPRRSDSE